MAEVSAALVKKLREMTSLGMMECKAALTEANGDIENAVDILRKRGTIKSAKKGEREAAEGTVECYIHANGKIGVMVEMRCETDFVAKNDEFKKAIREICMHIAWANPEVVDRNGLTEDVLQREKSIYLDQVKDKPPQMAEKIIEGKMKDFYSRVCLVDQKFVKDEKKTVGELITELIHKMGENMYVKRFTRFEVGS